MSFEELTDWFLQNPDLGGIFMFLLGFLESFVLTGLIWPSALLLFVAIALNQADLNLLVICLGAVLGSFSGDLISFLLGYYYGPTIQESRILKKRKYIFQKGQKFFEKYGIGAIFIGRFLPAIRPVVPIVAGLIQMPKQRFIITAILACTSWSIALAILVVGMDNIISLFYF